MQIGAIKKAKKQSAAGATLSPPVTPELRAQAAPSGNREAPLTEQQSGTGTSEKVPALAINGKQEGSSNAQQSPPLTPGAELGGALDVISAPSGELPFEILPGPIPTTSQSVTYSTRAIENVSDIMDAFNISTSTSIKYGTIHGNGNASFVNESKVLDSE